MVRLQSHSPLPFHHSYPTRRKPPICGPPCQRAMTQDLTCIKYSMWETSDIDQKLSRSSSSKTSCLPPSPETRPLRSESLPTNENISVQAAMIYGAYYIPWSVSVYPPEKLDYPHSIFYTLVRIFSSYYVHSPNFSAFITPSSDSNTINWSGSSNQDLLRRLVAGVRSSGYGTRVLLTIGMSISLE